MLLELIVRPDVDGQLEWLLASSDLTDMETGKGTTEALETLLLQYAQARIRMHVLLPAEKVLSLAPQIPARQTRLLERIIPNSVEDDLAEDLENCHFAWGRRLETGAVPVRVVSRAQMEACVALASHLGARLVEVVSEADVLPAEPGEAVLAASDKALYFRIDRSGLCGVIPLSALSRLEPYLEGLKVRLLHPEDEDPSLLTAQLGQISQIDIHTQGYSGELFEWLARHVLSETHSAINLCRGEFAVSQAESSRMLQIWKPVAAVLVVGWLLSVTLNVAEGYYYQKQAERYLTQQKSLYQSWFPGARMLASPRKQLESKLRQAMSGQQSEGFLPVLQAAAQHIGGREKVRVNSLQFSEERNELALEVTAPALADLEQIRDGLARAGYQVDIGSAVRESEGVRSRLKIRGGA
ncbi:MAG: hypothetical protein D6758_12650 [Gammaproteobacteria bacterium]|nr:MAG: hypothetical protein D6758_12650 [Gammaproteobacteria bacterium]